MKNVPQHIQSIQSEYELPEHAIKIRLGIRFYFCSFIIA